MGLYALNFLAIVMAVLATADTLSSEIGSGTIQAIVSKPLRRAKIVLGKAIFWQGWPLQSTGSPVGTCSWRSAPHLLRLTPSAATNRDRDPSSALKARSDRRTGTPPTAPGPNY